ncbi:MAG: 5'-nucleotidase C-terminal domain-containing protein, partial [Proteobacteria bacterium]|nr:5'-nucleotidase C-terminal domain-containing protein [Pseudomonadota bacterium]
SYTFDQICTFPYTIKGENKDNEIRKYSTFLTNFVTDTLLRHLQSASYLYTPVDKLDALFINAGTTRESSDFSLIDSEFINTMLPYNNSIVTMQITPQKLVDLLEFSLNSNVTGAFPAIAGIKFSYGIKKDTKKKYIKELWKYNLSNKLHTLIYLNTSKDKTETVQNDDCILGAKALNSKDKNDCIFGRYTNIKYADNRIDTCSLKDVRSIQFSAYPYSGKSVDDPESSIAVALSSFMVTGGDSFPKQSGYQTLKLTENTELSIKAAFTKALSSGNVSGQPSLCHIDATSPLDTNDILNHNLLKRIYYIPNTATDDKDKNNFVGEFGFAYDYPHNICVATQELLYDSMKYDDILSEELECDYTSQE